MAEYTDLVGIPFVDGGRDIHSGLDCWGLVREIYHRDGIEVQDYGISAMDAEGIARQMAEHRYQWQEEKWPEAGSLVLIRLTPHGWANHVGYCLGEGRFIHAYRNTGVCIDRLRKWRSKIVGFYRPKEVG